MAINTKIAGVNLNPNKKVLYGLQDIFGIGMTTAKNILSKTKLDPKKRIKDMSEDDINTLRNVVENEQYVTEGDLRQQIYSNISRLKGIKCYRGMRHRAGLPVRGQNTKKNARTRKGKVKIAVGGLNKPVSKK
jgi:small subunit ribosomal protein S13